MGGIDFFFFLMTDIEKANNNHYTSNECNKEDDFDNNLKFHENNNENDFDEDLKFRETAMNMFPKDENIKENDENIYNADEISNDVQRKTADTTEMLDDDDCLVIDQSDEESVEYAVDNLGEEFGEADGALTGKQLESRELEDDQLKITSEDTENDIKKSKNKVNKNCGITEVNDDFVNLSKIKTTKKDIVT